MDFSALANLQDTNLLNCIRERYGRNEVHQPQPAAARACDLSVEAHRKATRVPKRERSAVKTTSVSDSKTWCRVCSSRNVKNLGGGTKLDAEHAKLWQRGAKNRFRCLDCDCRWQEVLGHPESYRECSSRRKFHKQHMCTTCYDKGHGSFWKGVHGVARHVCYDGKVAFEEWKAAEEFMQLLKVQQCE